VIKINKKDIVYKDCKANSTVTLSKMDLLGIEYPNGSKDKFDFTGNNVKKNMDLVRSEKDLIKKRNEPRN